MPSENRSNHRIVLAARPCGAPRPENFRLETGAAPAAFIGLLAGHSNGKVVVHVSDGPD